MHNLDELRLARLKKGLSQKNVADELGMSQSNYGNIENGKQKKAPEPVLLGKIATIVGLKPPSGGGGDVPNPPPPGHSDENSLRKDVESLQQDVTSLKTELSLFKKLWNHFLGSGRGGAQVTHLTKVEPLWLAF